MVKFWQWKIKVKQVLVKLANETEDEKERNDLNILIIKLDSIRYRELSSYLTLLNEYCQYHDRREVCRELLAEPIEPGE